MLFRFITSKYYTYLLLLWMLFFLYSSHVSGEESFQTIYSVGKTVFLSVRENISISDTDDVHWVFGNISRIRWKEGNISNPKTHKYDIFKNGTLKICDGSKADSGLYNLIIYNKLGKKITNQTTEIIFLELVSKLSVSLCVKDGNISITCTVGVGDDVHFLWTWQVNGSTQSWKVPKLASKEQTISFNDPIPDNLTCTAFNSISKLERKVHGSPICRVADENAYLEMRGVWHRRTLPQNSGITPMDNSVYVVCRPLHHSSSQTTTLSTPEEDEQVNVYV
ncbi:T-cell surface antigen CD2-like isoform X2 [Myxocyprinus asiaticus]|uniref:T-cell surface antigen CD2-like isoform X2 n=1 Tax=Myxocyprinus asiaticus TaxID=70543 RepID=UPI00222241C8|nr:T-cell surface antigen CD2-like isoform X2 [Myxocyprinus asiaticus]